MDAESFKKEFLPYHRKLYRVAYRLLENSADAEDIVQEAYLKLWDKREGLTVISNPEAFSVTLVKNMCFDLLRSGKYILSGYFPVGQPGSTRRRTTGNRYHSPLTRTAATDHKHARYQRLFLRRDRTSYRIEFY